MSIKENALSISINDIEGTKWIDDEVSNLDDPESISSEENLSEDELNCGNQQTQEIWEPVQVWTSLQTLPGVEQILELLKNNNFKELLLHKYHRSTGILVATWTNNKEAIKFLLANGANVQSIDEYGRCSLHLAAYQGFPECIQILTEGGANANAWDLSRKITPLHCAASRGCVLSVRLLLKAGADVNAGLTARSPLHYAVQSDAVCCVKELLEAGACPNNPQVFTETPLHVAAAIGSKECVRLLLERGADIRVQYGPEKITPLHLAAEDGNAACAKLLLDSGAQTDVTNSKLQTPLHLASISQSAETLELLLKRGANPNSSDQDGRTPLHGAIVKVSRSSECVKLLLKHGVDVNKADSFGYTPLHLAALNEFSQCVMLLINHGGDVTARTNGGISALSFIVRRTPNVIPKYLSKLDYSIKLTDHEIGDVDCELKLDFRVLVPSVHRGRRGESELLLNFIEVGQRAILKHPLCETFLYLKWKRIRKFFLFSLFYHTVFVVLFTSYIIAVFLRDCPHDILDSSDNCRVPDFTHITAHILIVFNGFLLAKEVFQIFHNWEGYIRHWDNWLQWLIIICVFCTVPSSLDDIKTQVASWQHHVAAVAIFITWLELMMNVGRFPIFGLYVQMFTTVALNFSKFLLAYSCLLIAFGLSFGVLFANYKAFNKLLYGLLKTVIMMSGELEFEDLFYDPDEPILYSGTAHFMFLLFVLLVTVILTNLMVGLAVSDIQGLQQSAGLDRLVRQAELIAHLESMLFSRLLRIVPTKLITCCHRAALLLTSHYHWALYIRPNDPREDRIPKDLIQNIYKLVVERRDKTKMRYRKGVKSSSRKYHSDVRNSIPSINKSTSELGMYTHMYSDNTMSNMMILKSQFDELYDEIKQYNVNIQQKLNQLTALINQK